MEMIKVCTSQGIQFGLYIKDTFMHGVQLLCCIPVLCHQLLYQYCQISVNPSWSHLIRGGLTIGGYTEYS